LRAGPDACRWHPGGKQASLLARLLDRSQCTPIHGRADARCVTQSFTSLSSSAWQHRNMCAVSHLPRLSPANCEHDARRHTRSLQRAVHMDVAAERARRHIAQLAADNRNVALAIGHEVVAVATPLGRSMTRKAEAGAAYATGLGVFEVVVLQVSNCRQPAHDAARRRLQGPPGHALAATARPSTNLLKGEADERDKGQDAQWSRPQGVGRNTRMAASDPSSPARATTNSRSNSGTNSEVRAPECVGMRASE